VKVTPRRARWIGRLGTPLLCALAATWRVRMYGKQLDLDRTDALVAFRHGEMLVPAYVWRRVPAAIMISEHGDGELIAQVVRRLGRHVAVRGSSTRGGARAFLEMVRRQGEVGWAITPDGPRGPSGMVHDGVIQLAAEAGRAITPVAFDAASSWRLRSWDRFMIPRPFARVAGYLGQAIDVPRELDRHERKRLVAAVQEGLAAAAEGARRALANW
jgi:lysophospholipid acyltransferase (LPLAT)-like uncharacterized protein